MSETTTTKTPRASASSTPGARKIPPPVSAHPMAGTPVGPPGIGITTTSIDGVEYDVDPVTATITGLRA